ncbi:hypothetical protein GTA08_BOTSDO11967 [Botryosphaeria dothidea]|uniref:Uncharacterized protein n=1 Tax=Botryosphaeria dothidea TaxID=55169 RepID=A0A8H4J6S2_9PEZI|nr:hypothetical protein GTA08_BOTSDO11967 [Botryosphaeria dothidea]
MSNQTFTITAPPGTDIWRKPPSTNSFNAPTRSLLPNGIPVPLKSFQRARITFSGPWTTRYDQGGLLLHVTKPDSKEDRWLKTGIEFYRERPYLSTVATQTYSDWSVAPPSDASIDAAVTVEVRRETDELGTSLWVYEVVPGKEEEPLRECTWWFAEEGEGWAVDVRAMAARPAEKESVVGAEGLVVSFSGVEVEIK